jgi:hypothetical protein
MDRTTVYIIALRLIEIKKKLEDGKQLTENERKVFLLGTGKSMPSIPSDAVKVIDELFRQLKKIL